MNKKQMGFAAILTISVGLTSACCTTSPLKGLPPSNLEMADLVDAVQRAIEPVWNGGGVGGVPINNVTIVLQTVHDNKVSGEADYLLAAVKGYYDKATTNQITLKLSTKPLPPPGAVRTEKALATEAITRQLREMLEGAQKQVKSSYGGGAGSHTLYTNEVDVQLQFQITVDVSGGIAKWAILPVSLSASDEYSAKTTDTITVSFAAPKPGA